MAEISYPSPNHNTRNVTDAEYETISAFNGDGVHALPSNGDVVVAGTGLQVLVKAGTKASLRGHVWEAGSVDIPLTVSANASGSTRYDVVVLRLDRATWDVTAVIVEGTPGAGVPSISTDTSTTGTYDMSLALLTVQSGAGIPTIAQATRFAPHGVTPANTSEVPLGNRAGDIHYRPDVGSLELWDGSAWNIVHYHTGWLNLSAGYSTWEDAQVNAGLRHGNDVTLRLWKRRVESTFSANDTSGSKIATLPDVLTPRSTHHFPVNFTGHAGTATVQVRTDGGVWVIEPQKDVTPGRVLALTCSFPIE